MEHTTAPQTQRDAQVDALAEWLYDHEHRTEICERWSRLSSDDQSLWRYLARGAIEFMESA